MVRNRSVYVLHFLKKSKGVKTINKPVKKTCRTYKEQGIKIISINKKVFKTTYCCSATLHLPSTKYSTADCTSMYCCLRVLMDLKAPIMDRQSSAISMAALASGRFSFFYLKKDKQNIQTVLLQLQYKNTV